MREETLLPACPQDVFNYMARYFFSNYQIQCVLRLDERIDALRLTKAVKLMMEAEPVLGSRFIENSDICYWERQTEIDEKKICLMRETDKNTEQEIQNFLTSSLESYDDPQVQIQVLRGENDVLCLKVNHACSDGGGVKEYVQRLAQVYTALCEDPAYSLPTNMTGRRDQGQLFKCLGVEDSRTLWNPALAELQPTWAFPCGRGENEQPAFLIRHLKEEGYRALKAYVSRGGVTINDVLLAAYYRALFEMVKPEYDVPMEILVTVDLRRYLPARKAEAICNLSGFVNARVARIVGELFTDTVSRVHHEMKKHKSSQPGLHSAAIFEMLGQMPVSQALSMFQVSRQQAVQTGLASPFLSNFGQISDGSIRFGGQEVIAGYMVTPIMFSPGFMLGVSTYRDVLTLTVGIYQSTVQYERVEELLDRMDYFLSSLEM
jgi:NRPS condensation-like uncharacterized protein